MSKYPLPVGTKVIPLRKTQGMPFEKCKHCQAYAKGEVIYLYITKHAIGFDNETPVYTCSKYICNTGNFFNFDDVIPFYDNITLDKIYKQGGDN
jgi:hypothetical protein